MSPSSSLLASRQRQHYDSRRRCSSGVGFYFAAIAALPCAGVALTQLPSSSSLAAPQQRLWPTSQASQEVSDLSWKSTNPAVAAAGASGELASSGPVSLYEPLSPASPASAASTGSAASPLLVGSPEIGALLDQEAGFQSPSLQPQPQPQPQPQLQQRVSRQREQEQLEAELRRTSKVAAFLAQDAVALSQELRGLETTLTREGFLTDEQSTRQERHQGAQLQTSFVNSGMHRSQGRQQPQQQLFEHQDLDALEVGDTGVPQDVGLDAVQPASLDSGAASGSQEMQPLAGDADSSSAGPSENSDSNSDSTSDSDVANVNNETEQVVSAAVDTFDESQNGTEGASGSTVVMAPTIGARCGRDSQPACSTFNRIFTMDYHFTMFWSFVHWSALLSITFLCLWCCNCCGSSSGNGNGRR